MRIEPLLSVLMLVAGGYVALAGLMYLFQERLVFFPARQLVGAPADVGLSYEDVYLETSDGETLHAWWIPHETPRATLLFFHGNAGNVSHRLQTVRVLHDLRLNVLIFDYRGYGRSTGEPSEKGLYRDAETAWRHVVEARGADPARVVLHGRSLGSGPATWLAERAEEGALILESPFTSIPDVGAHHYPFFPVRLLSRIRFDNVSRMPRCGSPVLVLHSPDDRVIPVDQGRRVFEAAREPKAYLELTGTHEEAFVRSLDRYVPALDDFLTTHVGDGSPDGSSGG